MTPHYHVVCYHSPIVYGDFPGIYLFSISNDDIQNYDNVVKNLATKLTMTVGVFFINRMMIKVTA